MHTLPFQALHTFLSVARHQGIRPAAQALHLTPGAVSRQVAALEAHLGIPLLARRAGSMAQLTREGLDLVQRTQPAMDQVASCLNAPQTGPMQRPVVVNTSVTLAMHWLIPQLPHIQQTCQGLTLNIQTDNGPANPLLPVDVFIRRDPAELHPLPAHTFMAEHATLVTSPQWASTPRPSQAPLMHQLPRWPRVAARSRPDLWPVWCQHHGVQETDLSPPVWFDNTVLAIQAVLQGLGVGVLPLPFLAPMLKARSLLALPLEPVCTGHYAYALRPGRDTAHVRVLTDWLIRSGKETTPH